MGPTPFYGARAENPPFAKKQTNICRRRHKKRDKIGPVAPRGVDPRSPSFQGM